MGGPVTLKYRFAKDFAKNNFRELIKQMGDNN